MRCAIWYHLHNLKNVKNTHGGVSILVELQADTLSWVSFTFLKLYKWYQIEQRITYYTFVYFAAISIVSILKQFREYMNQF